MKFTYHDCQRVPSLSRCSEDVVVYAEQVINDSLNSDLAHITFWRDTDYTGEVYVTIHAINLYEGIVAWDAIVDYIWDSGIKDISIAAE